MKIAIKSCFTMLVEDTTLIQNAATPYPVEFAFSKDWDGFAKTALFEAGTEVDGLACDQQDPLPGQYQHWHRRLRRPDGR